MNAEPDMFKLVFVIFFGTFFISLFPKLSLLAFLVFAFFVLRQSDHNPAVRSPAGERQESNRGV